MSERLRDEKELFRSTRETDSNRKNMSLKNKYWQERAEEEDS